MTDEINHPPHYQGVCKCTECGADIEAIQITERHDFIRGNALKYLLRAGKKGEELMDLQKARWYLDREIAVIIDRNFGPDAEAAAMFASPVPAAKLTGGGKVSPDHPTEMVGSAGPFLSDAERRARKCYPASAVKMPAETVSDALYWMRDREGKK